MTNSFYLEHELPALGLASCGEKVLISRKASIYGAANITIGSNVRVDDFCILSGKITIGNFVHVSAYAALYGGDRGIHIDDFCSISARTTIYAITDDYAGPALANPTVPAKFRCIRSEPVILEKHVLIGASCVVLPGVKMAEGSSFGAMSLINRSSDPWTVNVGIPFKKMQDRSRKISDLEKALVTELRAQR